MQRGPIPFCPSRLVHVLLPFQINGVAIIVMAKKPFKNFVNIKVSGVHSGQGLKTINHLSLPGAPVELL